MKKLAPAPAVNSCGSLQEIEHESPHPGRMLVRRRSRELRQDRSEGRKSRREATRRDARDRDRASGGYRRCHRPRLHLGRRDILQRNALLPGGLPIRLPGRCLEPHRRQLLLSWRYEAKRPVPRPFPFQAYVPTRATAAATFATTATKPATITIVKSAVII